LALAVAGIIINLVALANSAAARQGVVIALLITGLAYGWGVAWRLNHQAANDPRERWVGAATDDTVHLLTATVRDFSRRYTNSERDLLIFAAVDDLALRWYLRDFFNLRTGHALPHAPNEHLLITYEDDELTPATAYVGAALPLSRPETPHLLNTAQSLRWWFFYESPLPIPRQRVILWLRADLAGVHIED
jgi:hypothetical protein